MAQKKSVAFYTVAVTSIAMAGISYTDGVASLAGQEGGE